MTVNRHWPTPRIPDPPVSAQTHGDPRYWTDEEWEAFRAWARSLENYGPAPKTKTTRDKKK